MKVEIETNDAMASVLWLISDGDGDTYEHALADISIRVAKLSAMLGIDLGAAISNRLASEAKVAS